MKIKYSFLLLLLLLIACTPPQNSSSSNSSSSNSSSSNSSSIPNPPNTISYGNDFIVKDNNGVSRRVFNTDSYYMTYFYGKENKEEVTKDIKNIFNENISLIHKVSDRHYYYNYDQTAEEKVQVNNLKVIDDSYGTSKTIYIEDKLFELFKIGIEITRASEGSFNIFAGSLAEYWKYLVNENIDRESVLDPYFNDIIKSKVEKLTACTPKYNEIDAFFKIDFVNKTVQFNQYKDCIGEYAPSITFGGLSKGYANDILKQELHALGYDAGYIYGAASSITYLGDSDANKDWKLIDFILVDPYYNNDYALRIMTDKAYAASTSGGYDFNQSYGFVDNNGKYIHRHNIVDPISGEPKSYSLQVSVISENAPSAVLDAVSTALMNKTQEEGLKFLKRLEPTYQIDAIWCNEFSKNQTTVTYTSNLESKIKKLDNINYKVVNK